MRDRRLAFLALALLAAVLGLVIGSGAALVVAAIGRGVLLDLQGSILVGGRRVSAVLSGPVEITNDAQLINDTVIREGATTWDEICTPAYETFCPPASQRQGQ